MQVLLLFSFLAPPGACSFWNSRNRPASPSVAFRPAGRSPKRRKRGSSCKDYESAFVRTPRHSHGFFRGLRRQSPQRSRRSRATGQGPAEPAETIAPVPLHTGHANSPVEPQREQRSKRPAWHDGHGTRTNPVRQEQRSQISPARQLQSCCPDPRHRQQGSNLFLKSRLSLLLQNPPCPPHFLHVIEAEPLHVGQQDPPHSGQRSRIMPDPLHRRHSQSVHETRLLPLQRGHRPQIAMAVF